MVGDCVATVRAAGSGGWRAPVLAAAGVADRCEVVASDFFHDMAGRADCYLLANVLHDWDDTAATVYRSIIRRRLL